MRMTNPDVGGTQDVGTQDVHGGELLSVLDEMCSWSLTAPNALNVIARNRDNDDDEEEEEEEEEDRRHRGRNDKDKDKTKKRTGRQRTDDKKTDKTVKKTADSTKGDDGPKGRKKNTKADKDDIIVECKDDDCE